MNGPPAAPDNPYVGPRAFTRADPLFGRDVERIKLVNLLISERIVLLHSPSGAGKTSLIQAGVIPELEAEQFRPLPPIRVNRVPPVGDAVPANRYVASALHALEGGRRGWPAIPPADLAGLTLSGYLDRIDAAAAEADADPVVLIFDQFEEILTVEPADLGVKDAFFAQVGEALSARHRWALFAMREEYVAALDPYLRHIPTRLATTFRLGLLEPPQAAEAIQKPAAQKGVDFTGPAADRLIAELVAVQNPDGAAPAEAFPFVEPVQLQVVCHQFWERLTWETMPVRDGRPQIEPDHVKQHARVGDALAEYYETKVAAVVAAAESEAPHLLERQIREWIDTHLITERGTRAQLRVGAERGQTLPEPVVQALIDAYLIRREGRPGDRWYELAHDRLVQPIQESNAVWLRQHLEPVQLRARQWDETGRRREALLHGDDLRRARRWADTNLRLVPDWEQRLLTDYLGDSVREQRSRLIRIAQIAAIAIVAVGAFLFWNLSEQRRAGELDRALARERDVTQSNLLASQAGASLQSGELDLALLLAAEGVRISDTLEARRRLIQALTSQPGLEAYLGHLATAPTVMAVSPDGRIAASANCAREEISCVESEVQLWDLRARRPIGALRDPAGGAEVLSLAFSPDGQTIATGSRDRGLLLWDAASREPRGEPLVGSERAVSSVAFSRDGATLAAGSPRGTIVLWDPSSRQPRGPELNQHTGQVTSLAFGVGEMLASGGRDEFILVWDGTELRLRCSALNRDRPACYPAAMPVEEVRRDLVEGADGEAYMTPPIIPSLTFNPDGSLLAAGTGSGDVIVWEVAEGEHQETFGVGGGVLGVAFSPDGEAVAAAAQNRALVRWQLASEELEVRIEAPGDLSAAAVGADGATIVAGTGAADVLLWDLDDTLPLARRFTMEGAVAGVAITPDGRSFAAATEEGGVAVWDADEGERVWAADDFAGPTTSVALSPDASTIFAGRRDGQVFRWEVGSGDMPIQMAHDIGAVNGLAMSPAGRTLVSGGADGAVRLWDLSQPTMPPRILPGDATAGSVGAVALGPGGATVAAGRTDGTVAIWEADALDAAPRVLESIQSPIFSLVFNPLNETSLAASGRKAVVFLDTMSGERAGSLPSRSTEPIAAIVFTADGTTLAMTSAEGRIDLWDVRTNLELGALTGHAGPVRSLSAAGNGDLLSGSEDGTVLLWSLSVESMLERACAITNRNLTDIEWEEFIVDRPYRATCPGLPPGGRFEAGTGPGETPDLATP